MGVVIQIQELPMIHDLLGIQTGQISMDEFKIKWSQYLSNKNNVLPEQNLKS